MSLRLIRTALPIVSSRVDNDKHLPAQGSEVGAVSYFLVGETFESKARSEFPMTDPFHSVGNRDLSDGSIGEWETSSFHTSLKPKYSFQLAVSNIRTRNPRATTAPTRILETYNVNVCCISETLKPGLHFLISLRSLDTFSFSRFIIRVSGDQVDIGIVPSVHC